MSMIGNFGRAFYNHMMSGFADVTEAEQRERLKACINCDKLDVRSFRCIECRCFLVEKTKWASQECPLGKWKKIDRAISDEQINKMTPEEMRQAGIAPVPPGGMIPPPVPGDCPGCPGKKKSLKEQEKKK